jgi:trimethylamine--corrinoid protein Co-methyltransferase
MAKRMLEGVSVRTETLATAMFEGINFKGDFLKQRITRELFAKEQYLPSDVIDRDSIRGWQQSGSMDTFARAKARTQQLLSDYQRPEMDPAREKELVGMVENLAKQAGMDALPALE